MCSVLGWEACKALQGSREGGCSGRDLGNLGATEEFPTGSDGKESACNAGDPGLIPGLGQSPGGGNGNPLQYSCLENPKDREAWQTIGYGITKSQTQLGD